MNKVGVLVFHFGEIKSVLELVCSVYGGEERLIQGFGGETSERDRLGYRCVDGRKGSSGSAMWGYGLDRAG